MKHKPRKRFGQNFLHDQGIISQIVQSISVRKSDHIVEVGPGKGAITRHLLTNCDKLTAIELDRDLIPLLKISLASYSDKLQLLNQDILTVDICKLSPKDEGKIRLVGNLPYNISTPVLFHFLDSRNCIEDMHFMLQKEVVDRLAASPNTKNYGRLSIIMQYYFRVEKCFEVEPHAFSPPPKVDSAIVSLKPYDNLSAQHGIELTNIDSLQIICKQAFQQRRKTLRNNLKKFIAEDDMLALGIDPSCRAENLTIAEFIKLANSYNNSLK